MKKIRGFKPVKIEENKVKEQANEKVQPKQETFQEVESISEPTKQIDIASAQEVIAKEKEQRVQEFIEKLKALCQEYNVSLTSGDIIVTAL